MEPIEKFNTIVILIEQSGKFSVPGVSILESAEPT